MRKRNLRTIGPVASCALVLLVGTPSSAVASCAAPRPLEVVMKRAETVFVGVVVETSNRQRNAIVEVEEVWKGDVDERVEVRGGPQSPNAASSVDTAYEQDKRYLFVPYEGTGNLFRDNACSSTQPYRARFDELRPVGVATGSPTPSPSVTEDVLDVDEAGDVAEPPSRTRWFVPGALALLLAVVTMMWLRRLPKS